VLEPETIEEACLFLLVSIVHEGDLIFIDVQSSLRDISYDEIKKHLFII
jgi:hypothetical protein